MALFSKPPAKKPPLAPAVRPVPPAPKAPHAGRHPTARELAESHGGKKAKPATPVEERPLVEPAGGDITVTGASLIELGREPKGFEVAQANPGLCAVLENAALLYASGQGVQARTLLEQGIATDHDAKLSPLAWLALFDLKQRAGDRSGFDQLAMQYTVQFERSAPSWDEAADDARISSAKTQQGGYVAINGKLTAASAHQIDGLKRLIAKGATLARVDLTQATSADDDGARLLADALIAARKRMCVLTITKPEKLTRELMSAVKQGVEGGEGAWLLALELLQWKQDRDAFENLAVEYAVAFELSPPQWEPPPAPPKAEGADAGGATPADVPETAAADLESIAWTGVMAGAALPHLAKLAEFANGRAIVPVDMSGVERVDFVCAGAMLNAINRIETQRKSVQLLGVSPIIRALLLLIGISPRHFLKKAQ